MIMIQSDCFDKSFNTDNWDKAYFNVWGLLFLFFFFFTVFSWRYLTKWLHVYLSRCFCDFHRYFNHMNEFYCILKLKHTYTAFCWSIFGFQFNNSCWSVISALSKNLSLHRKQKVCFNGQGTRRHSWTTTTFHKPRHSLTVLHIWALLYLTWCLGFSRGFLAMGLNLGLKHFLCSSLEVYVTLTFALGQESSLHKKQFSIILEPQQLSSMCLFNK